MSRITATGIPAAGFNIALIAVIFGPPTQTHLSAKEQHKPDQERGSHDQGRRQRLQIGEHAGLLPRWTSSSESLLRIVTHERPVVRAAPDIEERAYLAGPDALRMS